MYYKKLKVLRILRLVILLKNSIKNFINQHKIMMTEKNLIKNEEMSLKISFIESDSNEYKKLMFREKPNDLSVKDDMCVHIRQHYFC